VTYIKRRLTSGNNYSEANTKIFLYKVSRAAAAAAAALQMATACRDQCLERLGNKI